MWPVLAGSVLRDVVAFQAENLESREMWKGFIFTIMEVGPQAPPARCAGPTAVPHPVSCALLLAEPMPFA